MKFVNSLIIFFCYSLLSACSNTGQTEMKNEKSAYQEKLEELGYSCKKIKRTGTHLTKKRCTTLAQRENEESQGQKLLRNITKAPLQGSSGTR